jgi:hypothetical protein
MTTLAFPNIASSNNANIPVGARVRIAAAMVDFFMFNMQEIGTVTANSGGYLGIRVTFDKPIKYQAYDGQTYEKTEHGFNAEHLQLLPAEAT